MSNLNEVLSHKEELTRRLVKLYQENYSFSQMAEKVGCSVPKAKHRVRDVWREHPELKYRETSISDESGKHDFDGMLSEEDVIQKHDPKTQIYQGLEHLSPGTFCAVIRDKDFRKSLGIPTQKWERLRDLDEFQHYQIRVDGVCYWCHPETAERLSEKIDLVE